MPIASCVPELPANGAQRKRPQVTIAKLPDAITVSLDDASFSIQQRDAPDGVVFRKA